MPSEIAIVRVDTGYGQTVNILAPSEFDALDALPGELRRLIDQDAPIFIKPSELLEMVADLGEDHVTMLVLRLIQRARPGWTPPLQGVVRKRKLPKIPPRAYGAGRRRR